MKRGNPHTIKNKGFDAHPEHINKNGRPKKLPELEVMLANVLGTDGEGKSEAEKIIEALKDRALKGDTKAAELLLDRSYGKSKNIEEHIGEITLNVNYVQKP